MISDKILTLIGAEYEKRILVYDFQLLFQKIDYISRLKSFGFQVYYYKNSELLRLLYDDKIRYSTDKWVIIVGRKGYIPYDIMESMYEANISYEKVYPYLNSDVIKDHIVDLNLIDFAYEDIYSDISSIKETESYIVDGVYSKKNLIKYCNEIIEQIRRENIANFDIEKWFSIADRKALVEYYAAMADDTVDTSFIEEAFKDYLFREYKYLSGTNRIDYPVILSKVLEFITKGLPKVALIVMDGMSLFDFNVMSRYWKDIEYESYHSFALIPTTTSVSRQCLLSGKMPIELINPFSLSHEEKEFSESAKKIGYQENQIQYARGYDADINIRTKCLSLIINDIDDLVHSQLQGRVGMLKSIKYLAEQGKVQNLIKRLHFEGFQVYITADHGNTLCTGIGRVAGTGIEVETKSKRMMVLKSFAETENIKQNKNMIEYPGTYLSKDYQYLVCNTGESLDDRGAIVMTHGGVSIDEVIVPFIKIKEIH